MTRERLEQIASEINTSDRSIELAQALLRLLDECDAWERTAERVDDKAEGVYTTIKAGTLSIREAIEGKEVTRELLSAIAGGEFDDVSLDQSAEMAAALLRVLRVADKFDTPYWIGRDIRAAVEGEK